VKRISKKNINQKLIGNSGSKLLIYFNKKYIIRKLSINKDTSTRLENQYKKIINFKKNKQIYVPEIYKSGYERFNFYYDMEYVNGENFPEFILRSNSFIINRLFKKILVFIVECKKKSEDKFYDSNLILNKIKELEKSKTLKSKSYKHIFEKLKLFKWQNISLSQNHGDLSLENILVRNENIFFVDISKNFIESFYLDLSKLLFDLLSGWSFRNLNEYENRIQVISIKQNYLKFLHNNFDTNELNLIKMLTLLDFLRVLNYCKNIDHLKLLKTKLKIFYDHFNNPMLW